MKNDMSALNIRVGIVAALAGWIGVSSASVAAQEPALYGPLYRHHAVSKKIIANGWDTPDTAFVRENLSRMGQNPLDGTAIVIRGQTGDPKKDEHCNSREMWQKWMWERSWFDQAREDLLACEFDAFDDNFIRINVTPGNVEWFDDEGWQAVANNMMLMAELAKDTGLKGFVFDAESYRHPQYTYPVGAERPFQAYQEIARQRGREVMAAVAEHYPDITILGFRFLSYGMAATTSPDPGGILKHDAYGLYPAFFNGMLDVLPPDAVLVEGVEDTYLTNSTQEFLRVYNELRVQALRLVAPENRLKYRSQVQVGTAIYLDTYINPLGERWRINDLGQPTVERLRHNLTNALAVSDQYVWLWGERSHWFETSSTQWHAERQNGQSWQQILPGLERAFAWARDPMRAASETIDELKAAGRVTNAVKNPGFTDRASPESKPTETGAGWTSEGLPASWSSWQKDYSQGGFAWDQTTGREAPGSAVASGVRHGSFIQVLDVKPGQQFVVEAHARVEGQAEPFVMIMWRQHGGHRMLAYFDLTTQFDPAAQGSADDWQRAVTVLTVPERAIQMVVLLFATGEPGADNQVWFDDIGVYEITADTLWE